MSGDLAPGELMKRILIPTVAFGILSLMFAHRMISPAYGAEAAKDEEEKSIQLPVIAPDLPDGKGLAAVNAACTMCHSTRYITMQPNFPRKTWIANVDKMRKTFGAPVSDQQAAEIVDYLIAVRGTPEEK
jgi:cytochrome c5